MKKGTMLKRCICCIMAICIVIFLSYGNTINVLCDESRNTINDEIGGLVNEFYEGLDWKIDDIIPIYNQEGNIVQYAINISSNGISFGYFIYGIKERELIKFAINYNNGNFISVYFPNEVYKDKVVIYVDEFNYCLKNQDEMQGVELESKIDNLSNLQYLFLESYGFMDYSYYERKTIFLPNHCLFGEDYIEQLGLNYCCASVAILNVLGHYKCFDVNNPDSIRWAYGTINSMGGVKKRGKMYVMNQENMGYVVTTFAKWYGGIKEMPYSTRDNPSINYFIEAIDKRHSSILGIVTKDYDDDGNPIIVGHAVTVIGYIKFEHILYGNQKYFLAVCTGWNNNVIEYLSYNDMNAYSTYGAVFKYK